MKATVYVAAILAFILGGLITFGVIRWLGAGSSTLVFVVGAVLGSQLGAVVHHRTAGATNSAGVKARIGAALAVSTIILGAALHATARAFEHPEVSVPIAVVGTFIFPFVLFDSMWKSLSRKTDA